MGRIPIKVAVRMRPAGDGETIGRNEVSPVIGNTISVMSATQRSTAPLRFNVVFGPEATQHDVFMQTGLPLLEAALSGQQVCLFAYGQTGSGKTYSLLGADGGRCPSKLDGVVSQVVAELFRRAARTEREGENEFRLAATFVEIYQNRNCSSGRASRRSWCCASRSASRSSATPRCSTRRSSS